MLIYMDESGDDGVKLDAGSSPRLLFAAVAFATREDADACRAAIAAFRRRRGLAEDFEFRHSSTPSRLLVELAVELAELPFVAKVAALDKAGATSTDGLYLGTLCAALRMYGERLRQSKVYVDERSGKKHAEIIRRSVRRMLPAWDKGVPRVSDLRACKSHVESLVQLADVAAGAAADALNDEPLLYRAFGGKIRLETKTPADL